MNSEPALESAAPGVDLPGDERVSRLT